MAENSDVPPASRSERPRRLRTQGEALRGRLRAHDPFELIRWLALSQPDPRKALAELVQNSLDAGARRVQVARYRDKGIACLGIRDDGEGVIPELDRPDALHFIATHVGHSRKKSLSPQQRLALMTQGQYGIGLLGFWSLGEMLEIRTALPGQRPHRLTLYRDRPDFLIEPLRGRLPIDERFTHVVVAGLHREALGALVGRRAADYLASELRGQLLARDVELIVEDRISRGRASKRIVVRPPRFLGEPLEALRRLEVPGHPAARLELYLDGDRRDGDGARGPAVYCSGTLVAEGFHELGFLGLDRPPWTDARLTGLVDFPGFQVAPGSRRGLVPDEAAGSFARALGTLDPVLSGILEALEKRRSEELDRGLIRDLQRAFRDFYRQRPRYELLPVQARKDARVGPAGDGDPDEGAAGGRESDAAETAPRESPGSPESASSPAIGAPTLDLLPPGPLDTVALTPKQLRVEFGGSRLIRAVPLDAVGRRVEETVAYEWSLLGDVGSLSPMGGSTDRVQFTAGINAAEGAIQVVASAGDRRAEAQAPVEVLEEVGGRPADEGIPEPELVEQSGGAWRSRMQEGRWQVNVGHRDYRAIHDRPALKLRYLAMLFAKEVVLRSGQDPRLEKPLEQLVEVAAYADRNLGSRRGRGARKE